MKKLHRTHLAAALVAALVSSMAAGARAESEPCREWKAEHHRWKKEVVGRYLSPVPQADLDQAVFELLQREAYLTSCDASLRSARTDLVAWRLVGRLPDEYPAAVVESVLEAGGFDVSLRSLAPPAAPTPVATPATPRRDAAVRAR